MNIRTIAEAVVQLFVFCLTSRRWTATLLMLSFDSYHASLRLKAKGCYDFRTVIFGVHKHRTGV